jgi:hypothetical protein
MRQLLLFGAMVSCLSTPALAADAPVTLVLKDHRFTPEVVEAPAGRPIRVRLINQDGALEEFDSQDLGVEQDVTPHGETTFTLKPLKPGTYSFMGELHADTASGRIRVADPGASPDPRK